MQALIATRAHIRVRWERQYRSPSGLLGYVVGERMVRQHAPETAWTITLLDISPRDRILELGCGAGEAVRQIVRQGTVAHVTGMDRSAAMVAASKFRNRHGLAAGRVTILQGDMHSLPLMDHEFDTVFSIHTVYFWDDPASIVTGIARVLKPGGRVVITASPGRVDEGDHPQAISFIEDQLRPLMHGAGFGDLRVVAGPRSREYRTVALVAEKISSG